MLEIRPIDGIQELETVYRLTHDGYVSKGYVPAQENGLLLHYPEFDVLPETTILVALQDEEIVGSISYTKLGPNGLPIDNEFKADRQGVEQQGRAIVDVWRLIVKDSCKSSRKIVFGLFAETLRRTLQDKMTTWLLTVNPQHEGVYQRLFNSQILARQAATDGLSNAPAVLLRFDRETLPTQWKVADPGILGDAPLGLFSLESLFDNISEPPALPAKSEVPQSTSEKQKPSLEWTDGLERLDLEPAGRR